MEWGAAWFLIFIFSNRPKLILKVSSARISNFLNKRKKKAKILIFDQKYQNDHLPILVKWIKNTQFEQRSKLVKNDQKAREKKNKNYHHGVSRVDPLGSRGMFFYY